MQQRQPAAVHQLTSVNQSNTQYQNTHHAQSTGSIHTKRSLQSSAQPNQKSRGYQLQGLNSINHQSDEYQMQLEINKISIDDQNTNVYQVESYLKLKASSSINIEFNKRGANKENMNLQVNQHNISVKYEGECRNFEYDGIYVENSNTLYQSVISKSFDKTIQNQSKRLDLIMIGGSNQGKKTLLLGSKQEKIKSRHQNTNKKSYQRQGGIIENYLHDIKAQYQSEDILVSVLQMSNDNKCIDKLSNDNSEVIVIGHNLYNHLAFNINSKEKIHEFCKCLNQIQFSKTNIILNIEIQGRFQSLIALLTLDSALQILNDFQDVTNNNQLNLLKKGLYGQTQLLSIVCLDKHCKSKEDIQKTLEYSQKLKEIKEQQVNIFNQSSKANLESVLQSIPKNIMKSTIIKTLPISQSQNKVNHHSKQNKQSFQFSQLDNQIPRSHNASQNKSSHQTPQQNDVTGKNFLQKRMTTINEQQKEDVNEFTTLQSQSDQSMLTDNESDRISISNIIHSQVTQDDNQARNIKLLEFQVLQKVQEEYQLSEITYDLENLLKKLKLDIHKQQKRTTQRNQKQHIDSIKAQIKQNEEILSTQKDKMYQVKIEKDSIIVKLNVHNDKTQQPIECVKDRKLREMEEIIKDMSKKLQEKDQIIAETIKLTNIQETFQVLKNKQLLLSAIDTRPTPLYSQNSSNVNMTRIESAFSPTLSKKQLEAKKNQAVLNRQKSGFNLNPNQTPTLTESSSQSILPLNTFEEKKETRALLDKKKNNSTANLFKWSKPTVNIKIATDESHNGSINSGNTSIRNNQILQQTVGHKIQIHNKMSMVGLSNSSRAQPSRHQSYQELTTEQSSDSLNNRFSKATKKAILSKKIKDSDQEKENKKSRIDFNNDDMDEGVQNIKKSIVPIRCINNLMNSKTTFGQKQSNGPQSCQSYITERILGGLNSPHSTENTRKMKGKVSQPIYDKVIKTENSLQRDASTKQFNQKNKLRSSILNKIEDKEIKSSRQKKFDNFQLILDDNQKQSNQVKEKHQNSDELTNSSCCNEDIQNTPPKIKQKIYQLASKNKFQNQVSKPKATIDISIKGHMVVHQGNSDHTVIRSQEVDLNDQKYDQQRNTSNSRETSTNMVQRKERLDTFLRKSFELMTTLRTSADQVSQLKPINRAAIRLQSQERSGIMSTKNVNLETNLVGNVCGSFSSQAGQTTDNRKNTLFGYSRSPQQQKPAFGANQQNTTQNESIIEQSKTIDNRSLTMQQNFNSLVEKSINCLKNYNSSSTNQTQTNLKEQIIAKCIKTGNIINLNESQNLTSTQLRWMNRTLLNKCKSNESLQVIPSSHINHEYPERPRSITLNHQSPIHIIQSKENIKNINEKNIPKWGELASIIKQNFSPTQQNSNSQSFQNCQAFDDKTIVNPQKQYMIKHNKIDLSQTLNNQITGIQSFSRPPTNPQNMRKKRFNENDDQLDSGEAYQIQNLQNFRVRSESHYLPGSTQKESMLRTPRDQKQEYNMLNSPSGLISSNDLLNNTYYQRRLQQQQSHQNLSQLQSLFNENSMTNLHTTSNQSQSKINLNINTNGIKTGNSNFSSSADFNKGFFTALVSPQFGPSDPIGKREKARPEVTELIERQRSRINSQSRKGTGMIGTDANYLSNGYQNDMSYQ